MSIANGWNIGLVLGFWPSVLILRSSHRTIWIEQWPDRRIQSMYIL
jgi:hypothetical protein